MNLFFWIGYQQSLNFRGAHYLVFYFFYYIYFLGDNAILLTPSLAISTNSKVPFQVTDTNCYFSDQKKKAPIVILFVLVQKKARGPNTRKLAQDVPWPSYTTNITKSLESAGRRNGNCTAHSQGWGLNWHTGATLIARDVSCELVWHYFICFYLSSILDLFSQ